jgi:hypothetical protein
MKKNVELCDGIANGERQHADRPICSLHDLGKRKKKHCFNDAMFAKKACANELGIPLMVFLKVRAWAV